MNPSHDQLLEEIECPICNETFTIPIFQCLSGHSLCNVCIKKVRKCPLCQSGFSNIRNFSLERLLVKILIKCSNEDCKVHGTISNITEHLKTCIYGDIKCKVAACTWVGPMQNLKEHLIEKHDSLIFKNGKSMRSHQIGFCISEFNNNWFWIKRFTAKGIWYWSVQHIFPNTTNEKYDYKITIYDKSGNDFQITQPCLSHTLTDDKLSLKDRYATVSSLNFTQEKMKLNIKLRNGK